jgi:hypothetical protein
MSATYNNTTDVRDYARRYLNRGWRVLPVERGGKGCLLEGWQNLRITEPALGEYFEPRSNVGILLGTPSGGLVDADLDCDEACCVAPRFLPETLKSGRGPYTSHFWYVSPGSESYVYKDTEGNVLLEIRSDNRQTLVEPSTHPSGDIYTWRNNLDPREIDAKDLRSRAARAAASSLLARYLPDGGRHDLALAFAGYMLKNLIGNGMDSAEAADYVLEIKAPAWEYRNAPNEGLRDLYNAIQSTASKIDVGEPVSGGPTLAGLLPGIGEQILSRLNQWFGWVLTPEEKAEQERQERVKRAQEAWPACETLAHEPDILSAVYERIKTDGLIGEETNAKLLTLGAVSLLRGEPISAIIKGTSSVGKSEVIKRVTKALPAEMIVERQSMSERALAYMGKDGLRDKILVVYELGGLGTEGKESLEMAKQILSEGCLKRQIAEGTNKGVHGKLVEVDGPTALWTTTTKVKTDYELSNRVFELTPDDSRPQTRSIIKNVFEGDRTEVDFGLVKALFTWIAGQDNRVVIPFGSALGELLPDSSVRMRREAVRVRNLICAHAVLHQASRKRDEQDCIIATLEDYEAVQVLVEDIVGATAEKSVRPEVRETVEAAQTLIESEEHNHVGVTISEMEAELNRDYSTTSRRIKAASPYLIELEEKRGRSKQFGLGVDLPAEANVLPTVDEVCKFACVCGRGGADVEHEEGCVVNTCKTRANLRANFEKSVPEDSEKSFTNRENSEEDGHESAESGTSADHLQTCKLHPDSCPNAELCVQTCTSFVNSEYRPTLPELAKPFSRAITIDFTSLDDDPADVHYWDWHGENRDVDWVASGLAHIISDELEYCREIDAEPYLPERHNYGHWAYLLLDSGYGEVPKEVVAAALDQVGYGD